MTDVIDMPLMRPLTVADLADRPDDGHRYELPVTVDPDDLIDPDLPSWAR